MVWNPKMRTDYVNTMDGDIIKHEKWYIDGKKFNSRDKRSKIDYWCRDTFGSYRHDNELDEGWWLQNESEYMQFLLTWSEEMNG